MLGVFSSWPAPPQRDRPSRLRARLEPCHDVRLAVAAIAAELDMRDGSRARRLPYSGLGHVEPFGQLAGVEQPVASTTGVSSSPLGHAPSWRRSCNPARSSHARKKSADVALPVKSGGSWSAPDPRGRGQSPSASILYAMP